jgi:signal peptidase I
MKFRLIFLLLFLLCMGSLGYYFYGYFQSPEFNVQIIDAGLGNPLFIPISGTGSMYPTFPKGIGTNQRELSKQTVGNIQMYGYPTGFLFNGTRQFAYTVSRRDIISFHKAKTTEITVERDGEEHGFIKRVIGVAGDTIELRDGIVFVNDEPQKEPYTALPRSTFGGDFLQDCKKFTVLPHKLFVMGDNRKISLDSRAELGIVDVRDIEYILPYSKQIGLYDKHFRDTSNDFSESSRISLDTGDFLTRLNELRKQDTYPPLKLDVKLSSSARRRGEAMLKYDDISFSASRSGYTMEKSMKDAGYSNIIWGEVPVLGYYESGELADMISESPKLKKFVDDKEFQDIGIAEVQGSLNSCPAHVVVIQFGGYKPPNYSKDVISSWESALSNLRSVYPFWRDLKSNVEFYGKHKQDIDRLLTIFDLQISRTQGIVNTMSANKWLSDEQKRYVDQDEALSREADDLVRKINDAVQKGD